MRNSPIWSSFPQTSGLVIEQQMFTVYISLSAGIQRDLLCLHFYLQGSSGDSLCSNLSLKGSRDIYCVYNYLCRDQGDNCRVLAKEISTVIKPIFIVSKLFSTRIKRYWVNPSKRGRMDGVFRGLAGLLRGISRGSVLAFLKCMDGSVLALLKCIDVPYWPS